MASFNPMREVLQNLADQFYIMNVALLHCDVEINALLEERTNHRNNKWKRRISRYFGLVDYLKPEAMREHKDRTREVMRMIQHFGDHYDDLKRRYLWALETNAELTMAVDRLREALFIEKAKHVTLEDLDPKHWKYGQEIKQEEEDERETVSQTARLTMKDVLDQIRVDSDEEQKKTEGADLRQTASPKRRHTMKDGERKTFPSSQVQEAVSLKDIKPRKQHPFSKSDNLMRIEDSCPEVGAGNPSISDKRTSGLPANFELSRILKLKEREVETSEENSEQVSISEDKLQIYALTTELKEKNELIDALTSQLKNRGVQIARMAEVINKRS